MPALFAGTPRSVLAIYAHPDDADVACGGALAQWSRMGARVRVIVATKGDKGSADPEVSPEDLVERRLDEVRQAAGMLGVAPPEQLGYQDGELAVEPGLRSHLVRWIRQLQPQVLLTHDPTAVFFGEDYYNHRDHRALGFAVLDAASPDAASAHYLPRVGRPHLVEQVLLSGTLEPSVWVDISDALDEKVRAVSCHRSQFSDGGNWAGQAVRLRAEEEGRRAGVASAEGFRRLRLGG